MPRCPLLAVCSLAAAAAFVPSAKSAAAPIAQADPGALWVADARGVLKLAVPSGDLLLGIGSAAGTRALAIDGTTGQVWAYGGGMLRAFDRQGERLFEVATPAQFLRTAQGLQANGVEQLIGGVLVPLGSQTVQGPAPDVRASIVYDDGTGPALYVAGRFTSIGGVSANDIARWDGTAWSALGAGIGLGAVDDIVSALEVYDGALYAGGLFSTAGGQPIADLARWDGWTWSNAGDDGRDALASLFTDPRPDVRVAAAAFLFECLKKRAANRD